MSNIMDKFKLELADTFATVETISQLVHQCMESIKETNDPDEIISIKTDFADELLRMFVNGDIVAKEQVTLVSVKFNSGDKTYDYIWADDEAPLVGDTVAVKSNWSSDMVFVTVVAVQIRNKSDLDPNIEYKEAYMLPF